MRVEDMIRDIRRVVEAIRTGNVTEEAIRAAEHISKHNYGALSTAAMYIAIAKGVLSVCKPICPESVKKIVRNVIEDLVNRARNELKNVEVVLEERLAVIAPRGKLDKELIDIAKRLAKEGFSLLIIDDREAIVGKGEKMIKIRKAGNVYIVEYGEVCEKCRFRSLKHALKSINELLKRLV